MALNNSLSPKKKEISRRKLFGDILELTREDKDKRVNQAHMTEGLFIKSSKVHFQDLN